LRAGEGAGPARHHRMSRIELLRAADRCAAPWKNGGGVTHEVAAFPPASGMNDFLWRVSIAEVRVAGPFSRFPGTDRTLAILDGRLELAIPGARPVMLSGETDPQAFAGEANVVGTPLGSAAIDLNVMTRRDRFRATILRYGAAAVVAAPTPAAISLLVATDRCVLEIGSEQFAMESMDCLKVEGSLRGKITGEHCESAYLVEITTVR
jgi:environmental stress-induced protein Ves